MAFTPEQIAKAYVGPQADIYDAFKDYATLEAKQAAYAAAQRKQQLELERKERAERNAYVNDLLAAQKANTLATGSQLDPLWNTRSQEIINNAMSPEGMEEYKANPAVFKAKIVSQLHQLGDNMESVKSGVKKVDEYLKNIYDKTGGALNVSSARNAIINTIGLDENGKPRDSFNAEDANIMGILEGTYDPLTKQNVTDPNKRAVIAANYFNPEKLRENVVKFKPDVVQDYVSYKSPSGVTVNQVYKIPSYYKKTKDGFVLDVAPAKGKDNTIYPVASDNLLNSISKITYSNVALANHEKDLLETKEGQKAYQSLDDEQWKRYVAADMAKLLPKPERLDTPKVDDSEQAAFYRNLALQNQNRNTKEKGHLSTVRDYVNNPQAAINDFPKMSVTEADVIGAPAGTTELIRLDAGPQGGKELKTANGSKVNVFLDPNTGKSYMVYRPNMTMAGVIKNPEEAKIGGKDMTNRLIPIPQNDNSYWKKNYNYSQYGNTQEDFPLNSTTSSAQPKQTATQTQTAAAKTQAAPSKSNFRKESQQLASEIFGDSPVNSGKKSKKK